MIPRTKEVEIRYTMIASEKKLLKSKVIDLEKVMKNFTCGSKGINMILSNQGFLKLNKNLGTHTNNRKSSEPFFVKIYNLTLHTPSYNSLSIACTLSGLIDHLSSLSHMQYETKIAK